MLNSLFFLIIVCAFSLLPANTFAQTLSSQQSGSLDSYRERDERILEIQNRIKNLERLRKEYSKRKDDFSQYKQEEVVKTDVQEQAPADDYEVASDDYEVATDDYKSTSYEVEKPFVETVKETRSIKSTQVDANSIFVSRIAIEGSSILGEETIASIIEPYTNKNLTATDMQKVRDLITNAYRSKGYVTSRAYIPPQDPSSGMLIIKVVEGKIGDIKIEGNRHSRSALLRKYIKLNEGDVFDFDAFQKDMNRLNRRSDRQVSSVLTPGQSPMTSDVTIKVKERMPLHLTLTGDNFGTKYTNDYRMQGVLTHNNLLGFDDSLALQYQMSPGEAYKLGAVKYNLPVFDKTTLGLYAAKSYSELDDVLKNTGTRGKSRVYSINLTQDLYQNDRLTLSGNTGFTYKDVFNFNRLSQLNEDRLRIVQGGLTADIADNTGRTIISNGVDVGIPGILDGTKKHPATAINGGLASREGGGGQFVKNTTDVIRVQSAPLESKLLVKSQYQISSRILNATEQYQIGGISNNRGYPNGEAVGDSGGYVSSELSFPLYFLPKDINMPFSSDKLYDALRMEGFFDYGHVNLRNPSANEERKRSLKSAGTGFRLNMSDSSYARVDYAWPLGDTPSDGDENGRLWFQVSKDF